MLKFGDRLKMLLRYKHISQKEFAERTHIRESRLSNIINCKCKPTLVEVTKMLEEINIPYDCFIGNVPIFDGLLEDYNDSHIFKVYRDKR